MTAESLDGWNVERDVLFSFVIDEKKIKVRGKKGDEVQLVARKKYT
jgi:hypothetical protein